MYIAQAIIIYLFPLGLHLGSRATCISVQNINVFIDTLNTVSCSKIHVPHQLPYNSKYVSRSASFPGVCKVQYEQQTDRQVLDSDDIIAAELASCSVTEQTSQVVVLLLNFDDTSSQLTALHLQAL